MASSHTLTCVAVLVSSLLVVMVVADDTPALRGGSQSGTAAEGEVSFSGEEVKPDWSWITTPPFTPPQSFEHYPNAKLVIISGASDNHVGPATCFLRSVRKYHPNPEEYPIIFYDLGLSDANRAKLATEAAPGVEMRTFKFDDYPDYFKIVGNTRGEYAWKPVIVMTVMLQTEKPVFWLDAGDRLATSLASYPSILSRHGLYTTSTSGHIEDWVYPAQFSFFEKVAKDSVYYRGARGPVTNGLRRAKMLNGAIVGLDHHHKDFEAVAIPWAACALQRECIAPIGSHRGNHRQDQAALTVLAHWKHDTDPLRGLPSAPVRIHQDSKTNCPLPSKWGSGAPPMGKYVPKDPRKPAVSA